MLILAILLLVILLLHQCHANVEKVIFLGPAIDSSIGSPYSNIPHLNPTLSTIRTKLHSKFEHSPAIPDIPSTQWYSLDNLNPGTRYEVRICWPATQPTAFDMDVYTEDEAKAKGLDLPEPSNKRHNGLETADSSWLLLRVEAKADFFTMNSTLMRDGLVVDIDIILDPYLLNVFPKSLLPTALHVLVVAAMAVVAVKLVLGHLDNVVAAGSQKTIEEKKKA